MGLKHWELLETERLLWTAVSSGAIVDARPAGEHPDAVADGDAWGEAREVRAAFIHDLLTTETRPNGRPPRAVRLIGARVTGPLDLTGTRWVCPLELVGCFFDETPELSEADAPSLRIVRCQAPAIRGAQLRTRGDLSLTGLTARQVDLVGAHVGGDLELGGAQLTSPQGFALCAAGLSVDGSMFCFAEPYRSDGILPRRFVARGEVLLAGARVGRQLNFRGALLANPDGTALNADSIQIGRYLFCDPMPPQHPLAGEPFTALGEVRLLSARIGGQAHFQAARLRNAHGPALTAAGASIEQHAFFEAPPAQHPLARRPFSARGEVDLSGASVGGMLSFRGATLRNPRGVALRGSDLTAGSHLACDPPRADHPAARHRFRAFGALTLDRCRVGGDVYFAGAELRAADGIALGAQRLSVDGHLGMQAAHEGHPLAEQPFTATGEVSLRSARIRGAAVLSSASLSHPGRVALRADLLDVRLNLWLNAMPDGHPLAGQPFTADGEVRLPASRVGGALVLTSAQVVDSTDGAAALDSGEPVFPGTIDLRRARAGQLRDSGDASYGLRLAGFSYDSLDDESRDKERRLAWIGFAHEESVPDAYEHLAAIYRGVGREQDARDVSIAKFRARRSPRRPLNWLGSLVLDATVGFGYRPGRALAWVLALVALSTVVFSWASHHDGFETLKSPTDLPQYRSPVYALDAVLPVVNLGQETSWSPTGAFQVWYAIAVIAGWTLVTILLAALTARLVRD